MEYSLALGSGPVRIIQNFGHDHNVFIRHHHENGVPDQEIIQRVWFAFAKTFSFIPGSSEEQRKNEC